MIKGINRNVIEIVETNSDLFERAILFVRPGEVEKSPAHLESCAHSFLARAKLRRRMLQGKTALSNALKYIFAAGAGAGLAVLLLQYF